MNFKLTILFVVLFSGLAMASDPSISSVDFEQVYVNQQATFTINIDSNGTNGVVRFVDDGFLVESKDYDEYTTSLQFSKTWSADLTRTISFFLDNISEPDEDVTNNTFEVQVEVMRPLDFIISDFVMSPSQLAIDVITTFTFTVANIGVDDYEGPIPVSIMIDGNVVCSSNVDLNNLTGSCSTTPTSLTKNLYDIVAVVNKDGAIPEFTVTNNSKSILAVGIAIADLTIDKIILPSSIRRSELNNIGIIIRNLGEFPSQSTTLNLYLSHSDSNTVDELIGTQQTGQIKGSSTEGFSLPYLFPNQGEYTLKATINSEKNIIESNYENNEYVITFNVQDFNINQLIEENRELRLKIIGLEGKDQVSQSKYLVCNQDLSGKILEVNSCQTNLNICNTNNATKIANWMKDIDANKNIEIRAVEALHQTCLYQKQTDRTIFNKEILSVENEMVQWQILLIAVMFGVLAYFMFMEYNKRRTKKSINGHGGFNEP